MANKNTDDGRVNVQVIGNATTYTTNHFIAAIAVQVVLLLFFCISILPVRC